MQHDCADQLGSSRFRWFWSRWAQALAINRRAIPGRPETRWEVGSLASRLPFVSFARLVQAGRKDDVASVRFYIDARIDIAKSV